MVTPYYQDDHVTLYHGDCLELADEWTGADVLVTDPPYGMAYKGFDGRNGKRRHAEGVVVSGDNSPETRDKVLAKWGNRPALVFGKWTVPRPEATRARLIWDKTPCGFMGDLSLPWGSAEEEIYVLGKGFVGKREANIIRCQMIHSQDTNRPDHPTPKPVALMEMLIAKCPQGTIADPFAGSGATLVAAKNQRRKVVGMELEERYCEIIAKRLAQDVLELEWTA